VAASTRLLPGDEIEVQLSIRAAAAAEYVHLRDPRPAGLEPGVATSGWRWDLGLSYYEEVRDSGENFFSVAAGRRVHAALPPAPTSPAISLRSGDLRSMYAPGSPLFGGRDMRVEESRAATDNTLSTRAQLSGAVDRRR
jgi:hypothetical protein